MINSRVIHTVLALTPTLAAQTFAQPVRVTGHVAAADNDRPVAEAVIYPLAAPNAYVRSDERGWFSVRVTIPATLIVTRLGFAPETLEVTDAQRALRIGMRPAALVLMPTLIRADQATSAA